MLGNRTNRLRLVGTLVVAGVLALLVYIAARVPRAKTTVLADGSRFTFVGVATGDKPFTTEKAWQKVARRWLPDRWQSWLTRSKNWSGEEPNAVTVLFTLTDPSGTKDLLIGLGYAQAVAEDGTRYPPVRGRLQGDSMHGASLNGLTLCLFPRRQREFKVEFFVWPEPVVVLVDSDTRQEVPTKETGPPLTFSIQVQNPFFRPFPRWVPQQLPITHTNGPLTVTLKSVTSNVRDPLLPGRLSQKWNLETSDPLWRDARPDSEDWSDAVGNRQQGEAGPTRESLDPGEAAWKLSLTFRRPDLADYTAAEKFLLPGLKAPQRGTFQRLTNEFDVLGVKFKLMCLAGAGTLTISNATNFSMSSRSLGTLIWNDLGGGLETCDSGKPFFRIESVSTNPLDKVRLRVIGSDGSELGARRAGWHETGRLLLDFMPTNASGSLTLEGTVSRARLFEFLVNPAQVVQTNK